MNDLSGDPSVRALKLMLAERTGQTLSDSRLWRIGTTLRPMMREHGFATLHDLVDALNGQEAERLRLEAVDAMLNHESSFFRDIAVFQLIEQQIFPVLRARAKGRPVRIWCAGCATGREPFSLAMALRKVMREEKNWNVSILATDVSPLAIESARLGLFSQMDVQRGLSVDNLLRWFEPVGEQWRISTEIRDMIAFRADNLLEPRAPFGHYDLILCRNVMMYFPEHKRQKSLEMLARYAAPETFLIVGAGETLIGQNSPFCPSTEFRGLYQIK